MSTILLVDDHPVFRQGVHGLLSQEDDFDIIAEASDGAEALAAARKFQPDLVVMDITMPNLDGIEATRQILQETKATKVVALSVHSGKQFVRDMIKAGASGYILKESVPEEMVAGIRSVIEGNVYLSSSISNVLLSDYKSLISASQSEATELASTLLPTKLHRPPIAVDIIPRVRLIDLLERGAKGPLSLISAPAGYGKSIVASQWLEVSEYPGCWVSLGENENDMRSLLEYLVEAIQLIFKGRKLATRSLLGSGSLPSVEMIGRYIISDIESFDKRFILVLDDYHHIRNRDIHELLIELAEHPSCNMHIALVSRRDPPIALARLKSQGKLTEITIRDIRFTVAETHAFLERFLHISISSSTAQILEAKMEGWVTGLHLAALSIKNKPDQERLITGLQATSQMVRDYLIQEVLASIPESYRWFLLRISLLDRFCVSLCDSLKSSTNENGLDHQNVSGWDFIQWLQRTNLFVISLDSNQEWFRYHHLFQELLQNQLKGEITEQEIADIQLRASNWFEKNGLVDEALKYALLAGDKHRAADIIERYREEIINADQWYHLDKWLKNIHESIIYQRPKLLLAQAWVAMHHFRFPLVFSLVERVEKLIDADPSEQTMRGEISLCKGWSLYLMGDGEKSLEQLQIALACIPESFLEARAQAEIIYALSTHMVGNKAGAIQFLDELMSTYNSPTLLRKARLLITYVFIHVMSGEAGKAEHYNSLLKAVLEQEDYAYMAAWAAYMQGIIHLQRCEWDLAIKELGYSVDQRFIHLTRTGIDSITGLILAYHFDGDSDGVDATTKIIHEYGVSYNDPSLTQLADSAGARLAILEGDADTLKGWMDNYADEPESSMTFFTDIPSLTYCRALIATGSKSNLKEAGKRLEDLEEYNLNHHNTFQLITVYALQAMAAGGLNEIAEATRLLKRAVDLAGPGGLRFPFLELGQPMRELLMELPDPQGSSVFVSDLLQRFESSSPKVRKLYNRERSYHDPFPAIPPEIESLTNRELDVLELLSRRLQNKEIAAELCISAETVKGHLKSIYQKLIVNDRRQAIKKAQELGII